MVIKLYIALVQNFVSAPLNMWHVMSTKMLARGLILTNHSQLSSLLIGYFYDWLPLWKELVGFIPQYGLSATSIGLFTTMNNELQLEKFYTWQQCIPSQD